MPQIMCNVLSKIIWSLVMSEFYKRYTLIICLHIEIFLLFKNLYTICSAVEALSSYLLADLIYY